MRFAAPGVLWLLLLVPVLGAGMIFAARRRRRLLERFASGAAAADRMAEAASPHLRAAKSLLVLAAVTSGIVALARPQWGAGAEAVTRRGVDVVLVLDTSQSMMAGDVPPDRLGLAKQAARTLLEKLEGDRAALVTFAGRASLACPLTLDHDAVNLFLEAADAESVSVPGTALADAVDTALGAFGTPGRQSRSRAVVVLTDGEDHEGGLDRAIAALRKAGVPAHALGCGTSRGAPIQEAGGGFKKDREGKVVTTRLDEQTLSRLAVETNGRYVRATPAGGEIDAIVAAIGAMDAGEATAVLRTRYAERFQAPLALAFAFLFAETLIPDRRRRKEVPA